MKKIYITAIALTIWLVTITIKQNEIKDLDILLERTVELYKETSESLKELRKEHLDLMQEIEDEKEKNIKLEEEKENLEKRIKELEDIKIISMEATAYTDDVASQGPWVGQTATGRKPREGIVAVDPNVIPLGTELYVEGYGNAIAGDTGGAIKGNRIDLFMSNRKKALAFGRKQIKVQIKE